MDSGGYWPDPEWRESRELSPVQTTMHAPAPLVSWGSPSRPLGYGLSGTPVAGQGGFVPTQSLAMAPVNETRAFSPTPPNSEQEHKETTDPADSTRSRCCQWWGPRGCKSFMDFWKWRLVKPANNQKWRDILIPTHIHKDHC